MFDRKGNVCRQEFVPQEGEMALWQNETVDVTIFLHNAIWQNWTL